MIRAIIVEDDPRDQKYLQALLEMSFPDVKVVNTCDRIPEAIEMVRSVKPELIFLDVQMPPFNGFNLLEATSGLDYHVIFTTSSEDYALKAIRFAALDYLLKPYGLDNLTEAMQRFSRLRATSLGESNAAKATLVHNVKTTVESQKLGIPIMGGTKFIEVKKIIWCQADGNYFDMHLADGSIEKKCCRKLGWLEDSLSGHDFFRIHRSYLINLKEIGSYIKSNGGIVIMSDGSEVYVAKSRKTQFLEILKERGIL